MEVGRIRHSNFELRPIAFGTHSTCCGRAYDLFYTTWAASQGGVSPPICCEAFTFDHDCRHESDRACARRFRHRRQSRRDSRRGGPVVSSRRATRRRVSTERPVLRHRRPVPAHGRIARRRLSRRRGRRHLPVARLAILRPRRQMGRQPAARRRHIRSPRRTATKSKSARVALTVTRDGFSE